MRDSATQGYSAPWRIVGNEHVGGTKAFLEAAYPNFSNADTYWDLRMVIALLTDAKAPDYSLESRGILCVVCLELLKGAFLRGNDTRYIMPPDVFDNVLRHLRVALGAFPNCGQDAPTPDQLDMAANALQGMNYYPFRRALKGMCSQVQMDMQPDAINRLVDIRNSLVHYGCFPDHHGEPFRQLQFILDFIGDFVMAALGYHPVHIHRQTT